MSNSGLALSAARTLASRLSNEMKADDAAFIFAAYEQVLTRPPTPAERDVCLRFLDEQPKRLADPAKLKSLLIETTASGRGRV
jgi:hypothetical protein